MANLTISRRNFIQSILEADIPSGITLSKLAPGTNGHVLQTVGGVVTSAVVSNSNITDDTIAVTKIAKSTANYVMKTNAAGTATEHGLLTNANLSGTAGITGANIVTGAVLDSPALTTPTISTLTTAGDMMYSSGSGVLVRLPKGTSRQMLQQNTALTAPEWVASPQSLMTAQGDILYASAANTPAALAAGTKGYALLTGGSGANPSYGPIARKNHLINGDFRISQRIAYETPVVTPTDAAYQLADRWKNLTSGSGGQTYYNTKNATPNLGAYFPGTGISPNSLVMFAATTGGKFGAIQWLESADSLHLRSQTVSLQCKMGYGGANSIADVRIAVVYWTGTADTITSDPISAWGVAGTNPTLVASMGYANTPTNSTTGIMVPSATTGATYKVEGISVPANVTNVGVMFWVDDTVQTTNDAIWITDIQLELGSICTAFERRPYAEELALCQRYYREYGGENANEYVTVGETESATLAYVPLLLSPPMRIAPSIAVSAHADWALQHAATTTACSAVASASVGSADAILISATTASGLTAGRAVALRANNTTAARLKLDSEL